MGDRRALSKALGLLAKVFESGFTPSVRDQLMRAGNPIPNLKLAEKSPGSGSASEQAARHERILGYAVLPYAGVFLNEDGHIGGKTETVIVRAGLDAGKTPEFEGLPPEHISCEAQLIAQLIRSPRNDEIVGRVIGEHLLSWLPSFALALRQNGALDYADAADVLIELSLAIVSMTGTGGAEPYLPPASVPTEKASAGVKQIAEHLAAHARSGMYLGRATIGNIARKAEAPRGFGGSVLMLGNLFRSSAHFESLAEVTRSLQETAQAYRKMWGDLAPRHHILEQWAKLWAVRIDGTLGMLDQVRGAVAADPDAALGSGVVDPAEGS